MQGGVQVKLDIEVVNNYIGFALSGIPSEVDCFGNGTLVVEPSVLYDNQSDDELAKYVWESMICLMHCGLILDDVIKNNPQCSELCNKTKEYIRSQDLSDIEWTITHK